LLDLFLRFNDLPVINPNSRAMFFWDALILLLIFSNFFKISVELTFDFNFNATPHMKFFWFISVVLFAICILLKFNMEYYEEGNSIKMRGKIIKNYFKTTFVLDFVAFLALISSNYSEYCPFNFFQLLFFIQYKNIGNIFDNIDQFLQWKSFEDLIEIFLVLFKLVCITHIFACLWHSIAYYQYLSDNTSQTWFLSINYVTPQSSWFERYMTSIYWSLTTLMTVGYGDITPKNMNEVSFCSFTLLCGTLVFGYCVNCVGLIMQKKQEREKEFKYSIE